eukprot:TRINITY_DN2020_c0_g3_i3.p1 TRINITY_DN2020_c0_g3~~TRINITY_DN2020_c0_g3_i3.p1  ORF type:complete len:264 (+),score=31.42 TRINITY_DN2020_c0_g3_i3:964-1755(+)
MASKTKLVLEFVSFGHFQFANILGLAEDHPRDQGSDPDQAQDRPKDQLNERRNFAGSKVLRILRCKDRRLIQTGVSEMSVANASLLARIAQLETIANASLLARVAQLESVANASLARIAQLEATVSAQAATIASLLDAMPPPPVLLNATYTVPATARGFNLTAAVLASPATTISITYLSGLWNGLAGYDYTAAGSGTCGATCRVPALPWVALIGRWGSSNSSWFLIGTAWSGSIDASRYLSPAANDGDYSDNNGSIIVRVVLR